MGASAAILAAVEVKEEVIAVIADSPFSNLENHLKQNFHIWTKLHPFFTPWIIKCTIFIVKKQPSHVAPCEKVNELKMPLFLIHSKDDEKVPYFNSQLIYETLNNKEDVWFWSTEKVNHIQSHIVKKDIYEEKVAFFLQKSMM